VDGSMLKLKFHLIKAFGLSLMVSVKRSTYKEVPEIFTNPVPMKRREKNLELNQF